MCEGLSRSEALNMDHTSRDLLLLLMDRGLLESGRLDIIKETLYCASKER